MTQQTFRKHIFLKDHHDDVVFTGPSYNVKRDLRHMTIKQKQDLVICGISTFYEHKNVLLQVSFEDIHI